MHNILIFANPISGRGRGKKIAQRLAARLRREGYSAVTFLERADRILDGTIPAGAIAAIVIGGDGTLRSVAQRLLLHPKPDGSPSLYPSPGPPPLLMVPMGTANLMAQHLGIAWNGAHLEDQVVAALRQNHVVELDTALANGQLMLLVAGVGLDAAVVHELDRHRSGPISYFSYVVPALLTLARHVYSPVSVTVDGKRVFGPAPAMVFIGNVREYGTGFPLLPLACSTDGMLDVCVLPCRSRTELLSLILRAVAGEHVHGEGAVYVKGRSIRVESATPIPVQVDGEPAGHTPLAVDLLPGRLGFIVPVQ